MTTANNSTDQPREEDRSYEDQYSGRGPSLMTTPSWDQPKRRRSITSRRSSSRRVGNAAPTPTAARELHRCLLHSSRMPS